MLSNLPALGVTFDLSIPSTRVIFQEPGPEPSKFLWGKAFYLPLDLIDFTHGLPPSLQCADSTPKASWRKQRRPLRWRVLPRKTRSAATQGAAMVELKQLSVTSRRMSRQSLETHRLLPHPCRRGSAGRSSRGQPRISATMRVPPVRPTPVLDGGREPATIGSEGERGWQRSSWKCRPRSWMP